MTTRLEYVQIIIRQLQDELPDPSPTAVADQLRRLQIELDSEIGKEVGQLRRKGISWARIGQTFGLSSSGAQSKWRWYAPRERNRYTSQYKPIPGDDV